MFSSQHNGLRTASDGARLEMDSHLFFGEKNVSEADLPFANVDLSDCHFGHDMFAMICLTF